MIVGTFLSSTIKRRPKEEKTSIELENVFIKFYESFSHNNMEAYYSKLSVEITKIEKKDLKENTR